jgi:hypothetical protein
LEDIPPYLAFQLKKVAWLIPCSRLISPTFDPASCWLRIAIIMLSENYDFFIMLKIKIKDYSLILISRWSGKLTQQFLITMQISLPVAGWV